MHPVRFLFRLLLGRRLPVVDGRLPSSGIRATVTIRRDRHGVAYIEAESDEDAWYGLGYCHGQDRAFQLEAMLRAVRGTAAELFGPEALPVDRLSRRIGFARAAAEQLEVMDEESRQALVAYADGVTDGATLGARRRAHEFAILRARPTPYSASDALGALKLMSFTLSSNWANELARLKILAEDGPQALAAIDPAYPEWLPVAAPVTAEAGPAVDRLADDLAVFAAKVGHGGASNNWAIASERTSTGRPILANDPHLGAILPPYWYLAHLRTPEWAVAGASFVGAPAFPAGHNGTAAWGLTAGLLDNTDLFIEELGSDRRSVREGDRFVPCELRVETIHVKGGEPVEEEVLITPRGPIIGPALHGQVGAISMRATWLDPRPLAGFLRFQRVGSFDDLRRAGSPWPALALNLVYADTSGVIGWQLVGDAPQRRKGFGTIPMPGWDPEAGWLDEPVPFDELPHLTNPATGFVATANAKPVRDGEGPFLGVDWIEGYRHARIVEELAARDDWDLDDTLALQLDQSSRPWQEMRDAVLDLADGAPETTLALDILRDWDGIVSAESPGACVFELFACEMIERIVRAKAPATVRWALGKGFTPLAPHSPLSVMRVGQLVRLIKKRPERWFSRPWDEEMADSLASAVRKLRERFGDDPARWAWGRVRPLTLRHPFGAQKPLGAIFNLGPMPWGGDANTVGQAAVDPLDPTGDPFFIASLRMALDVGNWDQSRFVLPGGQSGNPVSPHYDDMLKHWRRGEGVHIAWSAAAIETATEHTLLLEPAATLV